MVRSYAALISTKMVANESLYDMAALANAFKVKCATSQPAPCQPMPNWPCIVAGAANLVTAGRTAAPIHFGTWFANQIARLFSWLACEPLAIFGMKATHGPCELDGTYQGDARLLYQRIE